VVVEILDKVTDLADLRPVWDELALSSTNPSIYNTYVYTVCSWQHFDSHQSELRVLAWRDGHGDVLALLPLRLRRRRRGLELVLERAATVEVDRLSLLAPAGTEHAAWTAFLPAIASLPWDVWELPEVTATASPLPAIERFHDRRWQCRIEQEDSGSGLLIDLDDNWPEFLARHRSFRRRFKKFERDVGDYRIEHYRDESEILEGLAAYRSVEASSWKTGGIGIDRSDRVSAFYDDLLPQLAAADQTSVRILLAADEPIAADITHTFGGMAFLHTAVYADSAAEHSPGTIFTGLVLAEHMASGLTAADLLTGHADYLRSWAATEVPTMNLRVRRATAKNTAIDLLAGRRLRRSPASVA